MLKMKGDIQFKPMTPKSSNVYRSQLLVFDLSEGISSLVNWLKDNIIQTWLDHAYYQGVINKII